MKLTVGTGSDAARAEQAALMAPVAAGDSGEPMIALYQRYGSPLYGLACGCSAIAAWPRR